MAFHVELRDQREVLRAFNLSEAEVHARFVAPLRRGETVSVEDKRFSPDSARLTVIEGGQLAPGQLGLGQGWTNAVKRGSDVTARFLAHDLTPASAAVSGATTGAPSGADPRVGERIKDRILGRLAAGELALGDGFSLTGDLMAGHRVSARLAAVEQAVWELLHAGAVALHPRAGQAPLDPAGWEALLLDPAAWLTPGPDSPVISATA